jgi:hypothetical protein
MIGYLCAIPCDDVAAVWPQAWPLLEPAVALWRGRYDETSLRQRVADMSMQLWVATEDGEPVAAALTEINVYPGAKECNIAVIGGDGREHWQEWIEAIKAWAISLGCKFVTGRGRRGWERVMAPAGFRHEGTIVSLEL